MGPKSITSDLFREQNMGGFCNEYRIYQCYGIERCVDGQSQTSAQLVKVHIVLYMMIWLASPSRQTSCSGRG